MTFIHENKDYHIIYVQTGTTQSRQITTLAKLPTYSEPCHLQSTMSICLSHKHDTILLFNCSQVPTQHNTLICGWKNSKEAAELIKESKSRWASLRG